MDKKKLRKKMCALRDSIPSGIRKSKGMKIFNNLKNLEEFKMARVILLYTSFKSEVDTYGLIEYCLKNNKSVVLPKVNKNQKKMELYEIESLKELKQGYANILEPLLLNKKCDLRRINLVIAPGVAFDEQCNRLGYGGGYYDKLLKDKVCPVIALSFEEQILSFIPFEPNDIRMDKVITDKRIIVRFTAK